MRTRRLRIIGGSDRTIEMEHGPRLVPPRQAGFLRRLRMTENQGAWCTQSFDFPSHDKFGLVVPTPLGDHILARHYSRSSSYRGVQGRPDIFTGLELTRMLATIATPLDPHQLRQRHV